MLLTAAVSTIFWKTTFLMVWPWSHTRCHSCKEHSCTWPWPFLAWPLFLHFCYLGAKTLKTKQSTILKRKTKQNRFFHWPEPTNLTRPSNSQGCPHLSFPRARLQMWTTLYLAFSQKVSSRRLNSGPYICVASILLIDSSVQTSRKVLWWGRTQSD